MKNFRYLRNVFFTFHQVTYWRDTLCAAVVAVAAAAQLLAMFTLLSTTHTHTHTRDPAMPLTALSLVRYLLGLVL